MNLLVVQDTKTRPPGERRSIEPLSLPAAGSERRLVAIGASAGGPAVLARILSELDAGFPAAIAIVQHLQKSFTPSFAEFLQRSTALEVVLVTDEAPILPGKVYVGLGDRHLVATSRRAFVLADDSPVHGFRPSVTVLFRSVAAAFGSRSVGVILTGIGADGADGMLEMRQVGALTIAQDEESSTVYGMPRAALEAGGVQRVAGAEDIPQLLQRSVRARGA